MTQVKVGPGSGNLGAITGAAIREDLENFISSIDRKEAPFVESMKKVKATNVEHGWLTDVLTDPSATLAAEGADFSSDTLTTRPRLINSTGIFRKDIAVSGTTEAVNKAGVASEMSYQLNKATKEIRRQIDAQYTRHTNDVTLGGNVVRTSTGTRRPGAFYSYAAASNQAYLGATVTLTLDDGSGVALTGSGNVVGPANDPAVPSNYSADGLNFVRFSGTGAAVTRSSVEDLITDMYLEGGQPDMMLMPADQKVNLSALFGSDSTVAERRLTSMERKVNIAVTGVMTDFGNDILMAPSEIMSNHSGADSTIFFYKMNSIKRAQLRPTRTIKLDRGGDGFRAIILCEETFMPENPSDLGLLANAT